MKKFMSLVLVVLSLISCMSVTAFAADVAKVYPLSEAPIMERSKKIGGVTFSNVVNSEVKTGPDYYGNEVSYYSVIIGIGTSSKACMKSTSSNVEFYYSENGWNCKDFYGNFGELVTGKLGRLGYSEMVDTTYYDVLPYAGEKNEKGNWVGGLVWEFVMDDAHMRNGEYSRVHFVKAVVDNQPYYYSVELTNRPDYKNGTILPSSGSVQTNPDGTAVKPAEKATANPTTSKVYVNGKEVAFEAYNINGNNYFKLRDIALTLRGTEKQFEVVWDPTIKVDIGEKSFNGAIVMTPKKPYTTVGGEMKKGNGEAKQANLTTSPILMNNRLVELTAYNIAGNNFFKLRDLGNTFDFNVSWDSNLKAIVINTAESYDATT